ncbi:putative isomerase YddE [Halioglobus japonicus]|nr:putative isomerase YddE [Halioglobus japonicus]
MPLPIYQVDAFADGVFKGNPAAVMPLQAWLDDSLLQAIAMENNLSETAYIVAREGGYDLRWFTPQVEVDLCGHATLAAAHVLFEHIGVETDEILFHTRSGELKVRRAGARITLDFPATDLVLVDVDLAVCNALGAIASEALAPSSGSGAKLYVYEFQEDIAKLAPDFAALLAAGAGSVIVSAPGDECDVVSRFFGPGVGINEDPVTGSAHCSLVPYWAARLHKEQLQCRQISARGGNLDCELKNGRVFMTGSAVTFMQGTVESV